LGKLRVLSAKQVGKILENNGFTQIRQRGSHIIYQKGLGKWLYKN
jgi:predicted RNA binding protein YcfA (HicA-like mRNA interferase family)